MKDLPEIQPTDWFVTDMDHSVHVHPASDATHSLETVGCWCDPRVERHSRPLVIHQQANA